MIEALAKDVCRTVNVFGFDREGAAEALRQGPYGFRVAEASVVAMRRNLDLGFWDGRNEAAARAACRLGSDVAGFDEELAAKAGRETLRPYADVEAAALRKETDGAAAFAGIVIRDFHRTLQQTYFGAILRFVDLSFDSVEAAKRSGALGARWYALPLV